MNSTGIVRKIDDLGRIVIPKEIRNTLNIKESESLEIFVEDENIILKKHYKMNKNLNSINNYVNIIEQLIDSNIIITDREKVIVASTKHKDFLNTKINSNLLSLIEERKQKINKNIEKISLLENIIFESSYIITPIIVDADSIGSVICFKPGLLKDTDILSANLLCYLIKNEY